MEAPDLDGQMSLTFGVDDHEARPLEMGRDVLRVRDRPGGHPHRAAITSLEGLDAARPFNRQVADEETRERSQRTPKERHGSFASSHEDVWEIDFGVRQGGAHEEQRSKENASARPERISGPALAAHVTSVTTVSRPRLLEDERVGDDHDTTALRLREHPGAHAAGHAGLELRIAHRRLGNR